MILEAFPLDEQQIARRVLEATFEPQGSKTSHLTDDQPSLAERLLESLFFTLHHVEDGMFENHPAMLASPNRLSSAVKTCDRCDTPSGQCQQICRREFDLEAPPTGTDEHRLPAQRAVVDDHRELALLAERTDAAHHVAGDPLRNLSIGHRNPLRSNGVREGLQIKLGAHRNHRHNVALVSQGDQRLEHPSRIGVKRFRSFLPVGRSCWIVVVLVESERGAASFQQIYGWGSAHDDQSATP